ncbi:hypothetical protein F444_20589 [Phytophthora nicotianae P1976]|uniref:Uncharacterized protein n=1 Tax=Phytophthora nicotianae P1976 TaxID=1317066 RepID=A0A080Z441_PHYNI|nr:hypothetical protein F444_20589 [Phytophthora nicotianae P1976]
MLYLDYLGKVAELARQTAEVEAENEPSVKTKQCVHGVEEGTAPARSSSQSTSLQPEELGSAPTAVVDESSGQEQRDLSAEFEAVASDDEHRQRLCPTSPHVLDSDTSNGSCEEIPLAVLMISKTQSQTPYPPESSSVSYVVLDSDGEDDDGFFNEDGLFGFDSPNKYFDQDEEDIPPTDISFVDALLAAVGGMAGLTVENLSRK